MKPVSLLAFVLLGSAAWAETTGHAHHHDHSAGHDRRAMHAAVPDGREPVEFPPRLKEETLANMRDHLLAIQEITALLADKRFDTAADVAEIRLGMTSLQRHGAHEVAQYMPSGMRQIGHGMHQAASRFATAAKDAGVTGDTGAALRALATMQSGCVACHAAYRFK
ncbi:MAG: hypothetical protein AB1593_11360 [Pseudomonadota bacterium]